VTLGGSASIASLLPPIAAPLVGDRVPLRLGFTAGENGAVLLDALSIEMAAGAITGKARFGGPDHAIAGQFVATLPDLAPLSGVAGGPVSGSAG